MDSHDEEIARLKAENESLRTRLDNNREKKPRGPGFWRTFGAIVLIVLACVLALAGALSTWVKTTTLDTDTFVSTVGPLVSNEQVATALSDAAVVRLFESYDVKGRLTTGLNQLDAAISKNIPPNAPVPDVSLGALAGPLTNGLESAAKTIALKVLMSDQFKGLWEKMLRTSHTALVNVLTGKEDKVLTSQGNSVVLDLGELITRIKDELANQGLTFLEKVKVPDDFAQVKLFTSDQLGTIKGVVHLLEVLSWLLPLLSIIFFALGIWLARNHRKALMGAGIGLAIAMLVTLIVLKVAHTQVFNMIKQDQVAAAGNVIWNTMLSGLKQAVRGFFLLGLFVAIGAAIAGPYKWAVWVRGNTSGFFANRRARREGKGAVKPVNEFVNRYAWWFRAAGFIIAIIVLVALPTITGLAIILTVVILGIYLALIELFR